MRVGDRVLVQPRNQREKGRGTGVVVRVGETLVRVRFEDGQILPCLRSDCAVMSDWTCPRTAFRHPNGCRCLK